MGSEWEVSGICNLKNPIWIQVSEFRNCLYYYKKRKEPYIFLFYMIVFKYFLVYLLKNIYPIFCITKVICLPFLSIKDFLVKRIFIIIFIDFYHLLSTEIDILSIL